MRVSVLTGGTDPEYAVPLAASLADRGIRVEFVGNEAMGTAAGLKHSNIEYLNLRGNQDASAPLHAKTARVFRYYRNLLAYAATTKSSLFHILWLNKFELLDRTLLNAFYKFNQKKLVYTAHNVNPRTRDGGDTWVNRASLRMMYSIFDHIFVHTDTARDELVRDYGVASSKVSVIPFGLNTYAPDTSLSRSEARALLNVGEADKILLFFGLIAPYKGLDVLLDAMSIVEKQRPGYCRLIVAGKAKNGSEAYWQALKRSHLDAIASRVMVKDDFIPDGEVAGLFKAADALVLPYRTIYQSGPMSLAQRFGIPVIATQLGSFACDVEPGVTGFLCPPEDSIALAHAITRFFNSDLYLDRERAQKNIRELALQKYSWDRISETIIGVYARLAGGVAC
jgi:glycosyltransferase involved in cell wall biosynthesis